MTKKFKIAFVGAGYMATEHMKACADIFEFDLVGIYSRTKSKSVALQNEFGVKAVYDSIEDLYNHSKADLVIVTVNELSMNSISKKCFKFPWIILLEKPAGYNYTDALDIYNAAKAESSSVYVALNRRFYSSVAVSAMELDSSDGKRYVKISDQQDIAACRELGFPEKVLENFMYANSLHQIDLLRVFGRGEVTAVKNISPWDAKNPGVVLSYIEFDSGDIGIYEGIWNGPGPWAASINTADHRVELKPVESATIQNKGERHQTPLGLDKWDADFKPGLRKMAQHCLYCLQDNDHKLVSLEDSLESMKLVKRIFDL